MQQQATGSSRCRTLLMPNYWQHIPSYDGQGYGALLGCSGARLFQQAVLRSKGTDRKRFTSSTPSQLFP